MALNHKHYLLTMSKSILPFVAVSGLILTACNARVHQIDLEPKTAQVTVHLSNFSISQDDYPSTRATQNVSDYTGVKSLVLAFFKPDGTQVQKLTQLRSDPSTYTTFGNFSCTLPLGTYTVVALGCGYMEGDVLTLTSPTQAAFETDFGRETFSAVGPIELTTSQPFELELELDRISSNLKIISTDGRPQDITKIRTIYSAGSKSFNPTTGLATDNNGFTITNTPTTAVDATINVSSHPFLYQDEQTMTVTLQTLDAQGAVISTHTIEDVPFKRNRRTILTGPLFSSSVNTSTFQLETAWLPDATVSF